MSFVNLLFGSARLMHNIEVLASGNPKRIERRARNIIKARTLTKMGFWKVLWK